MRRLHFTSVLMASALAVGISCRDAQAKRRAGASSPGGEYSVRLESPSGRALPTYYHRGTTYVEGHWGDRYSIRVSNHTGRRVEAVVTVDGRDVISGSEGDYRRSRGYVIAPWGSVLIEGFRTSWSGVAAFRFTDVGDSYAARMGSAAHVGVVGVAIFEERERVRSRRIPYADDRDLGTGYGGYSGTAKSAPAPSCEAEDSLASGAGGSTRRARQGIGTGYGENTRSPASETTFVRRSSRRPDARLALYYDDRDGLVARGVIRRHYYRRDPVPEPNPFPESPDPGFAPPPPAYWWE